MWWPNRCWTLGHPAEEARDRAAELLARLNIPERLWSPVAHHLFGWRAAAREHRARLCASPTRRLLLDEPTASLDAGNREVVLGLIEEAKARGAAILGIFHDEARAGTGLRPAGGRDRFHAR